MNPLKWLASLLAPPAIKPEKSETPASDMIVIMASEQRRVFIALFLYAMTQFIGLGTLFSSGLYQLGQGFLMLALGLWIVCPCIVVLYVIRLSYQPFPEIHSWIEKQTMEVS